MDVTSTAAAFDRGAGRYDLMVSLNPGYHRELSRAAAELSARLHGAEGLSLLDLACGSGASTRALVEATPPGTRITGLDASSGMLAQAHRKQWPAGVSFEQAVAGELDVAAIGQHDGVQACYLFRNVPEEARDTAVAEVFDVLRPGGWAVIQEYSIAGDERAAAVWDAVAKAVIIPLGTVIDRNPELYRYLHRSVHEFDDVATFAGRLSRAGFVDVAHRTATGWQRGILHTFVARKPEEA